MLKEVTHDKLTHERSEREEMMNSIETSFIKLMDVFLTIDTKNKKIAKKKVEALIKENKLILGRYQSSDV